MDRSAYDRYWGLDQKHFWRVGRRNFILELIEKHAPPERPDEQLGLDVRIGSLPNEIPVDGPFDVITLLDVIEHVEDDLAALETVRRLLRPGGLLVITVPALMLLWSDFDVANHHYRRYEKDTLVSVIRRSGFVLERVSYFVSLLFPLIAMQRLASRLKPSNPKPEYDVSVPPEPLNRALLGAMTVERALLRKVDMPIGSSLVAICRSPGPS
jgi:SAM-dependent methyltransferase